MTEKRSSRLTTIDFLRGIAALGVVIHHAFGSPTLVVVPAAITGSVAYDLLKDIVPAFGFSGVYLFFVISGFCIHLRWVKAQGSGDGKPLEFIPFWKRRIIRLYPAYLVALLLYISFEIYTGKLQFTPFFFYDLFSHLFMLHNIDARTVYSFNKVFWTLAVEEQLYLAYFLLMWLRQRYGWLVTIAITFLMRVIWFGIAFLLIKLFGLPVPITESSMGTWCIWALGAISIEAYYGMIKLPKVFRMLSVGLGVLLIAAIFCVVGWTAYKSGAAARASVFFVQPLFGLAFFIILNYTVGLESKIRNWHGSVIRFVAWMGLFSYSLYLTHELIVTYTGVPPAVQVLLCLPFAWVFYLCFEKPFMNQNKKQATTGATS